MMPFTLNDEQAAVVRAALSAYRVDRADQLATFRTFPALVDSMTADIQTIDGVVHLLDGSLVHGSPFCRPPLTDNDVPQSP